MRRHQDAKVKQFDVSNVIYHKFSHGTVSYTLNGANVNVMFEFFVSGALFPQIMFFSDRYCFLVVKVFQIIKGNRDC